MSTLTEDPKLNIKIVKEVAARSFLNQEVLRDLTIAQAILESNLQNKPSELAMKYCNLFGQKPSHSIDSLKKGTKGIIYLWTKEYIKGKEITVKDGFLWNENIEDSFLQHKELFEKLPRYQGVLKAKTFEEAANEVRLAGYATDPSYTKLLISIYNKYLKV